MSKVVESKLITPKNKEYQRHYYMKKKRSKTNITMKSVYGDISSSVQDIDREGSHFAHFTRGSYINLGDQLRDTFMEDGFTSSTLANYNFLDIGGGLGKALIHFRSYHKSKCVSIEESTSTFDGSMLLFHELVNRDGTKIPFIPILGNAYALTDFGGAFIVYAWLQGVVCDLFESLFEVFVSDKTCMYFVTSEKYRQVLLDENEIVIKGKFVGMMERSKNSSRTLYIYYKKKILTKKNNLSTQWTNKNKLSNEIHNAFNAYSKFHNFARICKNKEAIYSLTNVKEFDSSKESLFQIKSVRKCRRKNIQNDYIPNKKKVKLVVPKKDKIIDLTIGEESDIDDESKCEISLIVRIILISERNGKVLGVLYF